MAHDFPLSKKSEKLFDKVMESLEVLMDIEPKTKHALSKVYMSVDTIRDQILGNI